MRQNRRLFTLLIFCVSPAFAVAWVSHLTAADEAEVAVPTPDAEVASADVPADAGEAVPAVSLAVARDRARTMYQIYTSTLDVLHDHYFHVNRAVLPARAMEDIFSDGERQSGAKTRWIAANAKAMNVDHEPADDFEKDAAKRISSGEKIVEQIDGNIYRFAGSVPLGNSCVQCHMGTLMAPPKKPRFAGLVISIPVNSGTSQNADDSANSLTSEGKQIP